jgi:hypothetical protein
VSPATALWLASLVGASLFFASGILSADLVYRLLGVRARPALAGGAASEPLSGAAARHPSETEQEEERWFTEIARAQALAESARREADMLREQLELELANRSVLDDEVGDLHARLEQATRRASEHQRAAALVPGLRQRLEEIEADAHEHATLRDERDALRAEVDRLRSSAREALAASLAPASLAPAAPPPPVHVDPIGVAHVRRPSQSGMTLRVSAAEQTLESSLTQSLSSLVAREPGVIVVLSDDDGLPVAGVGHDRQQETLSVLGALARQLAVRVKGLVDLERIERLELADAAGRALRVRFFDWDTQPLALACLGQRSLVANPDEERVVSAFPLLLRRWSA